MGALRSDVGTLGLRINGFSNDGDEVRGEFVNDCSNDNSSSLINSSYQKKTNRSLN